MVRSPAMTAPMGRIILHGRHVVVDLVARDSAVFVEAEFDIGKGSGRLRGPLQIFGAHPLTHERVCQRLATRLRLRLRAPALPPFDLP